jgi:hypothetical protein
LAGGDGVKPETKTGADPLYCSRCGDRYWILWRHFERCPGVVPEDLPCDCNPGFHEPDCVHAGGRLDDAR